MKTPANGRFCVWDIREGTGYWVLGTGYWVLGTGYWVLGTGYWVLGTGYWVLGTGYWVLGTGYCKILDGARIESSSLLFLGPRTVF
ncbi:hypothetical protein [Grimontia hollisae]|uniref:hypothetical protein n=1 Tax=Grimontia hollisae TaxID=673 RepID=UPI0012AC86A4|nr:hypothetical protein [Grimontia hollisae]